MALNLIPSRQPEPAFIAKARAAAADASDHPDADEVSQALDVIAHAVTRLSEIAPRMCDAACREAISCERYGMVGMLQDAAFDLGYAMECWRERPENQPDAIRAANAADWIVAARKEDQQ